MAKKLETKTLKQLKKLINRKKNCQKFEKKSWKNWIECKKNNFKVAETRKKMFKKGWANLKNRKSA